MGVDNFKVNILTLNCWGIPFVSKQRNERMVAVATYLLQGFHDIVCLQEVWDEGDYFKIKEKVAKVFQYSHYFYSGVRGSGICMFSKWPIEEVFFHAWPLNGYVHMIHHGDWFGGKGVALCRVKYNNTSINVYSAHLHAEYSTDDIYLVHRVLQAFNTAEFIKITSSSADLIVLAGDLNVQPQDLAYRIICETGILKDSCLSCPNNANSDISGTNERAGNTYTSHTEAVKQPEGKRIDYVLYHAGHNYNAEVIEYKLPLPDKVPGASFSYSDHDAVTATLSVKKSDSNYLQRQPPTEYIKTLGQAIFICQEALASLRYTGRKYLIYAFSLFLVLISTVGMAEKTVLDIPRLLIVAVLVYFVFMGTLWNSIESNSILAGQREMEIIHRNLIGRNIFNKSVPVNDRTSE